ncbi:dTDP-4-dehydrorhamnose reductase [Jeotgalibacillus terrae]|uniref:dTDP-4-dehydrorhamnose reductase n=1 Tax=Jeotgalibacillus terrae TaxID=587735 RepID=A0ABW5ZE68_9BACL|nr:dTDP-4-dehydrorhamnose reductase [Jeotgalibacillus terrae]MBM7579229.1 dTDP-4-dehydrorhamnose reductase [Jeotgalibacillus terrae]
MHPLKVMVTGSKGQLGQELCHVLMNEGHEVTGFSRPELDVTNPVEVRNKVKNCKPDVVIHAAAYTDVNRAEQEPEKAFQVNAIGTRNVALAVKEIGAKMVYISTDYVFDGTSQYPIREEETPNPLSVYGESKLRGEEYVRDILSDYFIVRTSWLYGRYGNNFVKKILEAGDLTQTVTVVNDQVGSPTYTGDLAAAIAKLIVTDQFGIYHLSNSGSCSWYEFAREIFYLAGKDVSVEPCKTEDFKSPAKRPAYSILDHGRWRENGFAEVRHWSEALEEFLTHYLISS